MKNINCILIVDDDEIAGFLAQSLIKEINIEVECIEIVYNGMEALNYLLEKSMPTLIFLDINMPVLNGFEFLQEYNNQNIKGKDEVKIVILTSSMREDDKNKALQLGAVDVITKPLNKIKMQEVLEKHFRELLFD